MNALQLQGIVKRYKGDTVLDNINLSVESGSTLVLFGPSGAGKTVLLRLIAGVIDPDDGTVHINGQDMAGVDPEDRGVGMAFQNFALFPHMTAYKNIASAIEVREPVASKLDAAVKSVASLLKIDKVLDHAPRALSNGQKQRTALARALVGSPSLLLLDDPLRNVDAKLRFEMRIELPALLAEQGTTVVYVTQDYKEAMALGDRIVVMNGGRIVQSGSPADIYLQPANVDIARQFGDPVINLFDVTPQQSSAGQFVTLSDKAIALPADLPDLNGRSCVLGIRPEAMQFSESTDPAAIPATIEAVTPLNEKTVTLMLTSGGREILLSRPAGNDDPQTGQMHVTFNPSAIHLFDRETGVRIPAVGSSAAGNADYVNSTNKTDHIDTGNIEEIA